MAKIAAKRLTLTSPNINIIRPLGHELAQCGGKLARSQSPRSLLFASLVSCQDANKARHDLAHEGVQVVLPGGRLLKKRFEENKGDSGS